MKEQDACLPRSSPPCSNRSSGCSVSLHDGLMSLAMRTAIAVLCGAAVGALLTGCAGSRTVFIPEASPIRIGPRADMRVYTLIDGTWTLSANEVRIPEGWYCVPPSYVAEEEPRER